MRNKNRTLTESQVMELFRGTKFYKPSKNIDEGAWGSLQQVSRKIADKPAANNVTRNRVSPPQRTNTKTATTSPEYTEVSSMITQLSPEDQQELIQRLQATS